MNKWLLICGVSFLCVSCSIGPDYKHQDVFSDDEITGTLNLVNNSKKQFNTDWYTLFNDTDLNNLIEEGLKNSPDIKVALEKLRQSRYNLYIDRAGFLPSFDGKGDYNKSNQNIAGTLPVESDYYQVGADASWELDIWGGQRRLTESAKAMLKATAANFDNVKISLIAEIATQYINWRLIEKMINLTEKNLNLQKQIFETVKEQYDAGLTDNLAFAQAQSVLNTTEMQLPKLKAQEKSYQNSLAVLIGKLPSAIVKNTINPLDKKLTLNIKALYDIPVDTIRNRPDVQQSEQQLIAENALIGQAIANMFPSVSLSGFLGYQNNTLSPIFGPDFNMYSTGIAVTMPFLHWGELLNKVKIQESATKQAFALYQASLLTAISDISNAVKMTEEESVRNKSAAKNVKSAKQILDLSLAKYKNGLTDFSDVLNSEKNKLSAEQDYLQSKADIYINIIRFYKAVGGGLATNHNSPACRKDATTEACALYKD